MWDQKNLNFNQKKSKNQKGGWIHKFNILKFNKSENV